MDIKKLTAKKSVQLIKNKEISVSEFVSLFVERSKIINNKINSLITICEDEAMERAKYIDENFNDFKDKELVGVPISIKDAINTNPDNIASIIIEPIQGEGGDNHFRCEFMQALRDIADENDIILIYPRIAAKLRAKSAKCSVIF